jgi:hypothetical protein
MAPTLDSALASPRSAGLGSVRPRRPEHTFETHSSQRGLRYIKVTAGRFDINVGQAGATDAPLGAVPAERKKLHRTLVARIGERDEDAVHPIIVAPVEGQRDEDAGDRKNQKVERGLKQSSLHHA